MTRHGVTTAIPLQRYHHCETQKHPTIQVHAPTSPHKLKDTQYLTLDRFLHTFALFRQELESMRLLPHTAVVFLVL